MSMTESFRCSSRRPAFLRIRPLHRLNSPPRPNRRASVSALDDAIAAHPEMKAEIFHRIAPPPRPRHVPAKAPLYQRDGQQSACP